MNRLRHLARTGVAWVAERQHTWRHPPANVEELLWGQDPLQAVRWLAQEAGGGAYLGCSDAAEWIAADPQSAVLVLGVPRSGKTSSVIIPSILAAPGPVVSTSTKPDVLAATGPARSTIGRIWAYDPSGSERLPPGALPLRWSPLPRSRTWDGALLMAPSMVAGSGVGIGTTHQDHWSSRATALLAPLLHAAALAGLAIEEVQRWVLRQDLEPAGDLLIYFKAEIAADVLEGIDRTHDKERSSIFSTAANVLAAYSSEGARASADGEFDVEAFVRSTDSIYIYAPAHWQHLAAPLVVGLLEDIRHATYARHRAISAGREPPQPPVLFALDEVANIAPIHDLPAMVSEAGGQGLQVLACVQDLSQVRNRWGAAVADGFLSLFANKLILPGIADPRTLDALSLTFGEYDRPRTSSTTTQLPATRLSEVVFGAPVTHSVSYSIERHRVLTPGEIAALPPGCALHVVGVRWAMINLTPYYAWPWNQVIAAAPTGIQPIPNPGGELVAGSPPGT